MYVGLPWLPLSSMFLASTLLKAGYKTIIIDDRFSRKETLKRITEHIDDTILVRDAGIVPMEPYSDIY